MIRSYWRIRWLLFHLLFLHRRVVAAGYFKLSLVGSIHVGCTADEVFKALPPQTRLHPAKGTVMASSGIYRTGVK